MLAGTPAGAAPPDNTALAEGFVTLAFGPPLHDEAPPLWRDGPVRVALLGEPRRGFKARRALGLLLPRLAALTGLALVPAAGPDAEITLLLVNEPARDLLGEHEPLAAAIFPERADREREFGRVRGSDCNSWFANSPGPPARMTRVLGTIRRGQRAESQWACMVDLLVRALGFREHRLAADWTMLSADGPWLEPTEEDRLMLRLLYAPELAEAEEREAAEAIALRLLAAWRPAGEAPARAGHAPAPPPPVTAAPAPPAADPPTPPAPPR